MMTQKLNIQDIQSINTMIYQLIKNENRKNVWMDESYKIVSMIYIKKDILEFITYYFNIGESVSKEIKHIKERIADFGAFEE